MLAFSDIIDFLLRLMSDEEAQAQFDQDPQGTLQQAGLEGVTADDIRDGRLQLADSGAVSATDDGARSSHPDGDDPVGEIGYTTSHYSAAHADSGGDHTTLLTIDDRDTVFFQSISDDDVTVTDNSVQISDSFNQDNSDDDQVAIQDNSDNDVTINADDSFNTSDDDVQVAIQDNDSGGGDETTVVDVDGPDVPPVDVEPEPEPVDAEDIADDAADDPADPAVDDVATV